jgi:phospholipase C
VGQAEFAGVGVSDRISKAVSDALTEKMVKGQELIRFGAAMTPWMLGDRYTVMAAGSRFGEIWIDYVEPPPQLIVAPPRVPVAQGNLRLVKHIVVLMMENRSFDHMLGYLSLTPRNSGKPVNGLKGNEINSYKGKEFKTFALHKTIFPVSPAHGFVPTQNQISNHMGGFVASFAEKYESAGLDVSLIMGHYDREMLPVYDQLATQFKICDNWHAAHPGPTWPNRFITVTGRLNQDQFGQFERDNPNLSTFTPSEATTIFDILTANNVTWRYYENGYSFIRLFTRYTFDTTNVLGFSRFQDDAKAGDLPQVIFIDPDYIEFPPGADDQAPSNPIDGQIFVGTVVNALLRSPAWRDTLLLITYDEHGGFYDHVEPPATPVKFEGEMDRYGLRVPTFIVSPYVEPGDVSSQLFDHASIQATIQRTFLGPMAPDLGPRVAHAADVGPLLTRQQPRPSIPPLVLPPPPDPTRRAARTRQLPFPSQDSEEFNDLLFLARMFTGMGPA